MDKTGKKTLGIIPLRLALTICLIYFTGGKWVLTEDDQVITDTNRNGVGVPITSVALARQSASV